ncbi:MAG: suppressor of fused domain protein [Sporichthyaceae bacterium]
MNEAIGRHITGWFGSKKVFAVDPPADLADRVPGLQVLEVAPGPMFDLYTYVTIGCWEAVETLGVGTEFVFTVRQPDPSHVHAITSAAAQHCGTPGSRLDRGSIVPLGRPWLPGSNCDRLLVTLPYPYGPKFEFVRWRKFSARLLWLLPISPLEEAFVAADGVEAFEARMESLGISFTDPARPSVV